MNYPGLALVVTVPLVVICSAEKVFTENQIGVVVSLAKYFKIAFCVFEKDERENDFGLGDSHPSKNGLFTGFLTFEQISQSIDKVSRGRTMVVLKTSNRTLDSLSRLSATESLSPFVWLLFSDFDRPIDILREVYIPFDCEFLYVQRRGSTFSVAEVYQIVKRHPAKVRALGYWSEQSGLNVADQHFYARRNSLEGHTLRGFIRNDPPYVFAEGSSKGGYLFEIWSELEFRINFSSQFSEFHTEENLKKSLDEEKVDFALARIPTNPSNFRFMDFSQPISEAKFYTFGHRPGSELDWDSYLKPFSANTWLVNLFWMLTSSAALAILYRIAWDLGTSEREAKYFIFTFSESFLTVFRAICMQGSDVTPRSSSCRLLFLSIYLTALVVTSAFSAALFSLLTVPKPRSPFTSLDEVVDNRRFKLGLPSDPNFYRLMEDFSKTYHFTKQKKFIEKLSESKRKFTSNPSEGLQRLCTDKFYVFLLDLPTVLYLMQNMTRSCQDKILPSGPSLFTEYIGFGFRKKNPYKKLINFHLVRMKNEGILTRLLLNYWPPQIPTVQATWVRVTLADISPILYMFALGAILGWLLLYAEKLALHFGRKNVFAERESSSKGTRRSKNWWAKLFAQPYRRSFVEF